MKKIFAITICVFFSICIGFSAFVFVSNDNISSNDVSVVFDYNDGNITPNYEIIINKNDYINESEIPNSSTSNENHFFVGWYETKSGFFENGNSSKVNFSSRKITDNMVLYAKYINKSAPTNVESGSTFNITKTTPIFYLSKYTDANAITSNFTLKNNIQVLYGNNITYDASLAGKYDYYIEPNLADVRVILDSDLTIDGSTFQLNSILGYSGKGSGFQQNIQEEFTMLDLNGYTITIKNGGSLNGYGLICNSKPSGGIVAENGTIKTVFSVVDFNSSTPLASSYANVCMPFSSFVTPYFNVETLMSNDGKLIGVTSLTDSGGKYSTEINLIGKSSSLINLSNGYIVLRNTSYFDLIDFDKSLKTPLNYFFNPNTYRQKIFVSNNPFSNLKSIKVSNINKTIFPILENQSAKVELGNLQLSIKVVVDIHVSLEFVDFPIPSFFDIKLENAELTNYLNLIFMPGSSFYADKNSTINLTNKKGTEGFNIFGKFVAIDEYPKNISMMTKTAENPDGKTFTIKYGNQTFSVLSNTKISNSIKKPNIIIDGKFTFESSNVDINTANRCYYIGGYINCSQQAISSIINGSNFVKLNTNFYYPINTSITNEKNEGLNTIVPGKYYSEPLVSNGKAYFQLDSQSIIESDTYDEINEIINRNGKKYYFAYTDTSFHAKFLNPSGLINAISPSESLLEVRNANSLGVYKECEMHTLDPVSKRKIYIIDSQTSKKMVNVSGVYSGVSDEILNTTISSPSLLDEHYKFTLTDSPISLTDTTNTYRILLRQDHVEFNDIYNRWVFKYVAR